MHQPIPSTRSGIFHRRQLVWQICGELLLLIFIQLIAAAFVVGIAYYAARLSSGAPSIGDSMANFLNP